MNLRKIQKGKERRAISPIIATLLLILIAIAAGVVVYAYVIGFVGQTSTNQGTGSSVISIDTASGTGTTVTTYVRNTGGSAAVLSAVYVTDSTGNPLGTGTLVGTATSIGTCSGPISLASAMPCSLASGSVVQFTITSSALTKGTVYQLKVTTSDGSAVIASFKAS